MDWSPTETEARFKTYLEMPLRVKEQVLWFDVSVGDALAVEILDTL